MRNEKCYLRTPSGAYHEKSTQQILFQRKSIKKLRQFKRHI